MCSSQEMTMTMTNEEIDKLAADLPRMTMHGSIPAETTFALAARVVELNRRVAELGADNAGLADERDDYKAHFEEADGQRLAARDRVAELEGGFDTAISEVERLRGEKQTLLRAVEVDQLQFQCLLDGGVDNWGGWSDAMDEHFKILNGDESKEGGA